MLKDARDRPIFALLALPETTPAALYSLYEIFLSAGRTWEELTGEKSEVRRLLPQIVTRDGEPVATPFGLSIAPHAPLGDADVVIVTDIALENGFEPKGRWLDEIAWVKKRYDEGAIICSVCTGTIFLAEAGLLNGHEATTHWSAVDLLKEKYPDVRITPQRILTTAGSGDQIITGGGATSWEDLALHLVARFCGGAEAVRISKIFLLGDHAEGQLPFAGAKKSRRHDDAIIEKVQSWIAENYHLGNPVAQMVKQSGLSERTFLRRFRSATGYSAMDYVQTLRIEEAKHMLEATDSAIEMIAIEVGYEEPNYFRRLFKRKVGITPGKYRQKFSKIARLPT